MDENVEKSRRELQNMMAFLGAISAGLEEDIGESAKGMAFLAGKELGIKHSQGSRKTDDLKEAVEISKEILQKMGFLWQVEPWKKKGENDYVSKVEEGIDEGNDVIKLVFRGCMIRQALFRYGHSQKNSLCYMMYGFLSGLTESVLRRRSKLNILKVGPNACLKELIIGDKIKGDRT